MFLTCSQEIRAEAGNAFVPLEGKVLLMIGQDKLAIDDYVRDTGVVPSGLMGYTSIQRLEGLDQAFDEGGGAQHLQYLVEKYPHSALQIGLYMVDALEGVMSGQYDNNIAKLAQWVKNTQRPVYLRIGYEFDYPENHYDPQTYKKAFRVIVDRFRAEDVTNAAFVWHSYGCVNMDKPFMDWYPGDESVDWFAVSFFSPYGRGDRDCLARRAREHNKPFMIAEATPYGIGTRQGERSWRLWFERLLDYVEKNDVRVISYINCDWETLKMFRGQGWGDARVQADPLVKNKWLDEIQKEKYVKASQKVFRQLGFQDEELP